MAQKICSVEGCENKNHAKGMCTIHYARFKRRGTTGPVEAERKHGRVCAVDGCDRKGNGGRGMCGMHNMRVKKYGDPTVNLKSRPKVPCAVDDCEKIAKALGYCPTHYARVQRWGDVNIVRPNTERGEKNPSWRGDSVSYAGAHRRVYRTRGKASGHTCKHCGDRAAHWAYDHADESPLMGMAQFGLAEYSGNPKHYMPLCVPCHKNFDLSNIAHTERSLQWQS